MKAFTLAEILIVIIILGILAAVVLPNFLVANPPDHRIAQRVPSPSAENEVRPMGASAVATAPSGHDGSAELEAGVSIQVWLSIGVLTVLLFVLLVEAMLSVRIAQCRNPDFVIKAFGLTIAAFGTVFLVVAGYSREQIMPALTVLGTLAGYCFGKEVSQPRPKQSPD